MAGRSDDNGSGYIRNHQSIMAWMGENRYDRGYRDSQHTKPTLHQGYEVLCKTFVETEDLAREHISWPRPKQRNVQGSGSRSSQKTPVPQSPAYNRVFDTQTSISSAMARDTRTGQVLEQMVLPARRGGYTVENRST